jgi:manganese transport protein
MGDFVNSRRTQIAAVSAAAVVLSLNLLLLVQTFGVNLPFLG